MKKVGFALVLAVALAGCDDPSEIFRLGTPASRALNASRQTYKDCLAQNPNVPENCEAARRSFEADLNAYSAESARLGPLMANPPLQQVQPATFSPGPIFPTCPLGYHPQPDGRGNMLCVAS
jgi:hypothetical protein